MKGWIALVAASVAVLVAGASAAGGAAQRRDVRVEGAITALSASSITVSPPKGAAVTCAVPSGRTLAGFALQQRVEMRCRRSGDRLVLRKLEREDDEDRDDDDRCEGEQEGGHRGRH